MVRFLVRVWDRVFVLVTARVWFCVGVWVCVMLVLGITFILGFDIFDWVGVTVKC